MVAEGMCKALKVMKLICHYVCTQLSMNGFLEFSDPPVHYTYPVVFPTKDWPEKNDPAFIGIFFSKCRIGKLRPTDVDQRRPGVYFRYGH